MAIVLKPELEERIVRTMKRDFYRSADEVIERSLDLLDARGAAFQEQKTPVPEGTITPEEAKTSSILELARRIRAQVPEEEWAKLPADLGINHDHYLYGTRKVSE